MQLVCADLIVPMTDTNEVLEKAAVLVGDDGRIAAIGPQADLIQANPGAEIVRLANSLLMPGLINTHAHSGLLRGTAEALPVWEWLEEFIDPMHRVLTHEDAQIASALCYGEALLSGTTTFTDMWRFMDGSAQAANDLGIRLVAVPYVAEHPDHDYFETLDTNEALIEQWHGKADGRINIWVGLEHMFYATPDAWTRTIDMANRYDTGFCTHSAENRLESGQTQKRWQMEPIEALEHFGFFDTPKALLAHCVWLTDNEIRILADRNVGVAHNPISNMKLASGAARVTDLLAAGVNVGLGTDGEKENNNLDMFEEMKSASLLAKVTKLDAAALPAWDVLRMATIGGARALGLDAVTGSLEVGKFADMIALRTDTARMTPLLPGKYRNIEHNLVHAAQGQDVHMTMVQGRIVVRDGQLVTADMKALIDEANRVTTPLLDRRTDWRRSHRSINEIKA